MKKRITFILITFLPTVFCFAQSDTVTGKVSEPASHRQGVPDSSLRSFNNFSFSDAKKILKQPVYLRDSIWRFNGGIWKYKCIYSGNFNDSITNQIPRVYFGFEHYKQTSEAKNIYEVIKKENEKNSAFINVSQTGDEAFLVKDVLNFPFMIIRKDNKILKLRVYNVTDAVSLEELLAVAKKIVSVPTVVTGNQ